MARAAETVRQLAHHLHADEPLVEERCARSRVRAPAAGTDRAHQGGGTGPGQHQRQGTSGWRGGSKKNGPQAIGKSRGGWTTKLHMVAADDRTALAFSLSPGNAHDAPEGRKLLSTMELPPGQPALVMDRAYEDNKTRQLALHLGFVPVVPPKSNRISPWQYDREMYKRRNEVERLFRRLKGYPAHLLPLRKARRHLPQLRRLRAHRRYAIKC